MFCYTLMLVPLPEETIDKKDEMSERTIAECTRHVAVFS